MSLQFGRRNFLLKTGKFELYFLRRQKYQLESLQNLKNSSPYISEMIINFLSINSEFEPVFAELSHLPRSCTSRKCAKKTMPYSNIESHLLQTC